MAIHTRWFVPAPGPDETLASVVARAAAFYGTSESSLWAGLHGEDLGDSGTPDHPSPAALQRMGLALGVPARSLRDHLLDPGPRWLKRDARRAFCPACWHEDHVAGRPFGYRRAWARVFTTRCAVHYLPLEYAHVLEAANGDWITEFVVNQQATAGVATRYPFGREGELLEWIDGMAQDLDHAFFGGNPWPSTWRLNRSTAEKRLIGSFRQQSLDSDVLSINRIMVTPALRRFVHARTALFASLRSPRWDDFQNLADPGARRAAVWLLGWQLVPNLPEGYCPLWPSDL
jgi:hypothetical protein